MVRRSWRPSRGVSPCPMHPCAPQTDLESGERMTVLIFIFGACLTLLLSPVLGQAPPDLLALLESLRAVGPEGRGNEEARTAWRRVAASGAAVLPRILEALDGAGPSASNWIRTAADAVAGRELEHGGKLSASAPSAVNISPR